MFLIEAIQWFIDNRDMLSKIVTPAISLLSAIAILTSSTLDDKIKDLLVRFFEILGIYRPAITDSSVAFQPAEEFSKTKFLIKVVRVTTGVWLLVIGLMFAIF
jgi:hypothetical protein